MRKAWTMWAIGLLLLTLALPAAAQGALPRFEAADCMFTEPSGYDPKCGYVIVPEDRSNPQSREIRLATAIFRSDNPDKAPEPVIYLDGGPGGSSLEFANLQFSTIGEPFLVNHDVIFFDQRGIGLSEPALDCPEYSDLFLETLDEVLSVDDYNQRYTAALTACAERLKGEGINLASYNSAENAADVNDIRIALGFDKLNLYGVSYGSKLALTIMRDHPEAVRAAIIDSVYPPPVSILDTPQTFLRSLNILFADCQADPDCNQAYPDLERVFFDLIEELNANPATFQATNLANGQSEDVMLDGDAFASLIFQALYSRDIIPTLPESIYQVRDGNYDFPALLVSLLVFQVDVISQGMNTAVQCDEEIPFDSAETITAKLDELPPQLRGFGERAGLSAAYLNACQVWQPGQPNPLENQPISSDIPTLVVSGQYDPITPPAYGALAAETLSNSFAYDFLATGHGVIASNECAFSMAQDFLADPTQAPDPSCIDELTPPDFTIAGEVIPVEVTLVPFEGETFTTLIPDGWEEIIAGTFGRGQTGLDQTALAIQSVPGAGLDLVLPVIAGQFGADANDVTTREVNGLSWRLLTGEFQGQTVFVAAAEAGGQIYLVVLTATAAEADALYEAVLLPVVDNFQVK